ncbi:MAG: TIGR03084 family metal-binding protein [Dehalococcoidia bacterium]
MSDAYRQIVDDLAAEHASFAEMLGALGPDDLERPTHAPGWAVRDQVAHLANLDETATKAIVDEPGFRADAEANRGSRPVDGQPAYIVEARKLSHDSLADWWRRASASLVVAARGLDATRRMPWFGPPMSATSFITARLMECWSHGLDVEDVVPFKREPSDRLRHIVFLGVRTRNYSYVTRGLEANTEPVRVELRLPSGEMMVFGEVKAPNRITGTALDFCQVATRRRHHKDTDLVYEGSAAEEWLEFAQTFAGPPGDGRKPGQFPRLHP